MAVRQHEKLASPIEAEAPWRLPPRTGERIDRTSEFLFTFEGRKVPAYPGDTIASALAAAGVRVLSRSFKYHRPRGLLCCAGHCPNCLVQVGAEPNVRACLRPAEEGIQVRAQNAWPSLGTDVMALTRYGDRLLPPGFYYKTFIRPQRLWPAYERALRSAAGLGTVDRQTPPAEWEQEYLHGDVAVVGAGPAGMSAALAAAERGARVLLFDENPEIGGHLRYAAEAVQAQGLRLREAVESQAGITVLGSSAVLGAYENGWLAAVQGHGAQTSEVPKTSEVLGKLLRVRARAMVAAGGAFENPLVFDNNDLPGVMLGSAAQRLLRLYGVSPGERAVIVTANDDGWQVAADLHALGLGVEAIVEERLREQCTSPHREELSAAVPVFWGRTVLSASGAHQVTGVVIGRIGGAVHAKSQTLECDSILVSAGWTPNLGLAAQAGSQCAYDDRRGEFLVTREAPGVYVAGRAAGTHTPELEEIEGRLAGWKAAAYAGYGPMPEENASASLAERKSRESRRTSSRIIVPGKKKRFVCFCEDVTDTDLEISIAEGYDSLELLKRYSTVTMGPCQGKMCQANAIHLCARATGRTPQETGVTTSRSPFTPAAISALAGIHLAPVQVTPVHDWHLARRAKMMVAGPWLRPDRYSDPAAEIKAVRERVGLIDVSTLGKLRLTGPGVPELLEKIYINTWKGLAVGRARYGVMCNDEGVVLDDGVCAHMGPEEWYLTTTTSGADAVFEWIQWWLQSGWGEGVHLASLTEAYAAFNLAGPRSRSVLQKITQQELSNTSFPYMGARFLEVDGVPCRVLRIGFTGELSYEIHCPASYGLHLWEALMRAGEEYAILPFGLEAQRVLRLEKAHMITGQDTDAATDPYSANLGWAVKLDKPDFLGKRSLVRVWMQGPTQRLVGFTMARAGVAPEEGQQIVRPGAGGRLDIIGWVTSSRYSPTLGQAIGLCWLPSDMAVRDGTPFHIRMGSGLEEGRVKHGAFYDPEGERLRG